MRFWTENEVCWGLGRPGDQVWEKGGPKAKKDQFTHLPKEVILEPLGCFWRHAFLCIFKALFFRPSATFWSQRYQKGRFWEVVLEAFWGRGANVKIGVSCKRQLNFEGSGGSKNRLFWSWFLEGAKRAPLGGTFGDFEECWAPIGDPKEPFGHQHAQHDLPEVRFKSVSDPTSMGTLWTQQILLHQTPKPIFY